MPAQEVFRVCLEAILAGELVHRVSSTDKEFHFQHWFKARLEHAGQNFEIGGRNSYPDFRMVATTDGYELKGPNELRPTKVPNPHAGREHPFQAWRLKGSPTDPVAMHVAQDAMAAEEADDDNGH